jgi:uncharacterized protein (DUF433 family)
MKNNIIVSDPDILNGTPVFKGTRVPVQALFDYLQFSTVEEFLIGYPQINRAMVNEVLTVVAQKTLRRKRVHASA